MSGVSFEIYLDQTGAAAAITRLQGVFADPRPMLEDIGLEIETSTVERFETNVAPDGVAWQPSIRARETGSKTLVEQGFLRDSFSYRVDGEGVEIGSALKYAAVHQVGGEISAKGEALRFRLATGQFVSKKTVRIPARPMLGLSAEDQRIIPEIALEHAELALRGSAA